MKLNEEGLKDRAAWEEKGCALPRYDRKSMRAATKENPVWIHFGAGNIFRAFHAAAAERMLNGGFMDRGIIAVSGAETVEQIFRPQDDLGILVTLKADGSVEKAVLGSVADSRILDAQREAEFAGLREIFSKDSLQMATFTITEKGYALSDASGALFPAAAEDLEAGPGAPKSYMGKVAALLYARFLAGGKPIAMVSTDNCSHNGDKLAESVAAFARGWEERGRARKGFLSYVTDPNRVSFPWTMIDKITPRPDPSVERLLTKDGVEGLRSVVTSAHSTHAAPFVNAEECGYLVIEDAFPNGRPALERAGILFADRKTVDRAEKMKVCTCLNPLHTALAVFGCLLGYEKIAEEMKDADLRRLAERIGYREGLPAVTDPGILNPREFLDTVVQVRLPNPFLPDTPQRIATDTSQKLSVRFGETVKAYLASDVLDVRDLRGIPLVFAGWLRYLTGVDDSGRPFEVSPDPLYAALQPVIKKLTLGNPVEEESLRALLSNEKIFGVDLYEAGLAETVLGCLNGMLAGPGAVRRVLKEYTA